MDFHSLLRRDLQFLCKRNKIPAKMTNLAMADALKSLETVEGLDEYMNQNDANVLQSPASVAKLPPSTAARTTRRKTAMKAEPQSSSQLVVVNRSCRLKSKSLHGEMNQENTYNVKIEVNVAKTPAAWSTRKASAAASCKSKVQESKKGELVQSGYSTRRSTRNFGEMYG
ncbi:BnaCnng76790D [Brassica napus]|uniref:BnaCnng76790D protein n=1 Tax=Brassica napus TaxID=3708 RepID=A0A078K0U8_BRANA|nr:BnaCnng76790D [Brassica napus]